jgi:calcium-dependent protein kinase
MDQIFNAVAYLHSKNILHGDIKLENVLLNKITKRGGRRFTNINLDFNSNEELTEDINKNFGKRKTSNKSNNYIKDMINYEIKLIDFGCSKYFVRRNKKKKKLRGIIGTSIYCSPEVVDNLYDERSDEWSCGVLMYILLSGVPPFFGETEEEIFENIKKYNINFDTDELKNVSDNCKDLMKRLLNPEKQNRITAFDALKHPFFTQKLNPMKILTKHKDLSILKKFFKLKKYPTILHKVVVAYCCFNFIDKDEERKLSELFRFLDQKKQKKLTLDDFKRGFKEAKISVSLFELKNIMNLLDTDGNNLIEYQEFLRALCDKDDLLNEKNLRAVFDIIDKDKKGYANINDINNFIVGNGQSNFNEKALKKLDEQIGEKKDLKMTFEEFCDFIRNDKSENNKIESYKSLYYESNNVINEEDELVKDDEKNLENKRSHEI